MMKFYTSLDIQDLLHNSPVKHFKSLKEWDAFNSVKFVRVDDLLDDLVCLKKQLLKSKWDKECPQILTQLINELSQSRPDEKSVSRLPHKESHSDRTDVQSFSRDGLLSKSGCGISLCRFCNSMTKTLRKKGLSASENIHYRYYCGKCHCKKEDMFNPKKRRVR